MRRLAAALLCATFGCTFSGGYRDYGRDLAFHASAIDPRVGQKNIEVTPEGLTTDVYKDPMSEQAAKTVTELAPVLAEAIVKALLAETGLKAVGTLSDLLDKTEEIPAPVAEP